MYSYMSDLDSDDSYLQSDHNTESEIKAENKEVENSHYIDVQGTNSLYDINYFKWSTWSNGQYPSQVSF